MSSVMDNSSQSPHVSFVQASWTLRTLFGNEAPNLVVDYRACVVFSRTWASSIKQAGSRKCLDGPFTIVKTTHPYPVRRPKDESSHDAAGCAGAESYRGTITCVLAQPVIRLISNCHWPQRALAFKINGWGTRPLPRLLSRLSMVFGVYPSIVIPATLPVVVPGFESPGGQTIGPLLPLGAITAACSRHDSLSYARTSLSLRAKTPSTYRFRRRASAIFSRSNIAGSGRGSVPSQPPPKKARAYETPAGPPLHSTRSRARCRDFAGVWQRSRVPRWPCDAGKNCVFPDVRGHELSSLPRAVRASRRGPRAVTDRNQPEIISSPPALLGLSASPSASAAQAASSSPPRLQMNAQAGRPELMHELRARASRGPCANGRKRTSTASLRVAQHSGSHSGSRAARRPNAGCPWPPRLPPPAVLHTHTVLLARAFASRPGNPRVRPEIPVPVSPHPALPCCDRDSRVDLSPIDRGVGWLEERTHALVLRLGLGGRARRRGRPLARPPCSSGSSFSPSAPPDAGTARGCIGHSAAMGWGDMMGMGMAIQTDLARMRTDARIKVARLLLATIVHTHPIYVILVWSEGRGGGADEQTVKKDYRTVRDFDNDGWEEIVDRERRDSIDR
ncbi:hypothetical protein DAEQUDRAFT_738799 [Daedalea quercina L-15889]|uniref:Uncharacterized protein n=1 Tax=Daedalea quercina L-15889 TaxID=1314783 RepID=A0A165PNC2_9APHY|nr:hypothetical protein DAEQUDRAFT_738799 [Daedalea quercina L-15889]